MKNKIIIIFISVMIVIISVLVFTTNKFKNNDLNNGYQKTTILKSNEASTEILVRFNDNLYGKSFSVIDYDKNPDGPVGVIDKLTDKENIPKYNDETNTEEILNAKVDYASDNMIVLNYNNEYVLFEKIEY